MVQYLHFRILKFPLTRWVIPETGYDLEMGWQWPPLPLNSFFAMSTVYPPLSHHFILLLSLFIKKHYTYRSFPEMPFNQSIVSYPSVIIHKKTHTGHSLVGGFEPALWKIMEFAGMIIPFPTEWKVIIHSCSKPPTRLLLLSLLLTLLLLFAFHVGIPNHHSCSKAPTML